jgi:hypothetical protein
MVRTAGRALPVWVGFGGRCPAKGIALGKPADFGVATLLLLDFG